MTISDLFQMQVSDGKTLHTAKNLCPTTYFIELQSGLKDGTAAYSTFFKLLML